MRQPEPPRTLDTGEIKLAELLGALSHALDMTEGQPPGHCVRCCYIGIHVGRELGLGEHQIWELYYTLLLKDLGCSSNAARLCSLYMSDDILLKRNFKVIDSESLTQVLGFVLGHTGLKASLADRFRALANVARSGGQITREVIETRCHRGAEIARQMRFSEEVAQGIQNLDEHWDGRGHPENRKGAEIPIYAQIALLAQVIDVFHFTGGPYSALVEVRQRTGTWFGPELVAAFEATAARPSFWYGLAADDLDTAIFALEPAQEAVQVDEDYLDEIAAAFAQVVDSKSPFTNGHSQRVALFADLIAGELGRSEADRRWLRRAALLHDIGKLGVSNMILDKPGKLDVDEWAAMKLHAAHTETILARIRAFADMAPIAGAHHERLDGKGYPKGLRGDEITMETRILAAADVFDALTAARPYRGAMPAEKALSIMAEEAGSHIDPECLAALRRAVARAGFAAAAAA